MKAFIVINDWQGSPEFVGVLMDRLLTLDYTIAGDEDKHDLIITNDVVYLMGRSNDTLKVFVHCNPESSKEEIAEGILSLTERQVLERFPAQPAEVE